MAKRLLMLTISATYYAAGAVRSAVARLVLGAADERTATVLTYHDVSAADAERFERQMQQLRRGWRTVFADDRSSAPRGAVAVTFDDALQNVADYALPILARLGIRATIFVPTGYLATAPGWASDSGETRGAGQMVMSAEKLAALDPRLVRLGSHTVTHPRLARLSRSSADGLASELVESRRTLESISGVPVRTLALPYGSFNERVIEAAARAGYTMVFANVPVWSTAEGPLFGRVNMTPRDWPLEFAWDPLESTCRHASLSIL